MSTATPLLAGFSSKRLLTFSTCFSYRSPAPMHSSAHLVPTKKTDSVISCDALVRSFSRVRRSRSM
ncbi:hypothetical protein PEX1_076460 [Penicillium expansum]|uniref:Uncharacterized protein n=1 Tax=Penicillium expansum TaxID=27334 RepID=A0A0A2JX16_PENEN|nr:hypothetical protein PEX2_036340 [Penicillium expansum]KGO47231.1 hypothetical protein PEXP_057940 [Penicillium expansum]KGO54461.1 hypothetical protein PEX1_076460 [Penicillium expansum]KGO60022.1 hypothetical protein PEX2_036340 [Penicillium expansum]